jgi:hypothetical protein
MIALGKWLPDQPRTLAIPHVRDAKNVIPLLNGYGPARDFSLLSTALADRPYGAAAFRDTDGNVHVYAGRATKLMEMAGDATWADRTRSMGGDYATATTGRWKFTPFNDAIIAVNFTDDVQTKDMTTAGAFAALSGSPPKAAFAITFEDFVVLGRLNGVTNGYNAIQWSAAGDETGWTVGTDLSDLRTFPDGGFVQGLAATDVLYVFQQRMIRRGVFVGPPNVIQFSRLDLERGVLEPNSLCQLGRKIFFLSDNSFYVIKDAEPETISDEAVASWFFADCNQSFLHRMSAAVDPDTEVVSWAYASNNSPDGTPDSVINYHINATNWSYERKTVEPLFNALTLGYTLEGLDALTTDIDDFDISFDDPLLQGGDLRFAGFNSAFRLGVFTGPTLEALIETSDIMPIRGWSGMARVKAVTPNVGTSAATAAIGSRRRSSDATVYKTAAAMQASGRIPVSAEGRWFSTRFAIPAGTEWDVEDPITEYEYEAVRRGNK